MMETIRKEYKQAKSNYQDAIRLGWNEETDIGKKAVKIYNDTKRQYLYDIENNNTAILLDEKDSFERIMAFTETVIRYYTSISGKVDDIRYSDTLIDDFVALINKIIKQSSQEMGSNISAVEYVLTKDITDDVFADLVKKVGWESIFEIEGVEIAEGLAIDYQSFEYDLIILNDKVDLIFNVQDIILTIEANTDFFDENNDDINLDIDETLTKVIK